MPGAQVCSRLNECLVPVRCPGLWLSFTPSLWPGVRDMLIRGDFNNDGVRLNNRPFMTAGILRENPNIKWTKDRGTEPERDKDQLPWFWKDGEFVGDRVNDVRLTNAQKKAAQDKAASG